MKEKLLNLLSSARQADDFVTIPQFCSQTWGNSWYDLVFMLTRTQCGFSAETLNLDRSLNFVNFLEILLPLVPKTTGQFVSATVF